MNMDTFMIEINEGKITFPYLFPLNGEKQVRREEDLPIVTSVPKEGRLYKLRGKVFRCTIESFKEGQEQKPYAVFVYDETETRMEAARREKARRKKKALQKWMAKIREFKGDDV